MTKSILLVLPISLTIAANAGAQTSYPMLMGLEPVAAQAGATTEHTIQSRYSMYGAYQVLVTGEDVTGEIVHPEFKEEDKAKPPNLQEMKVRFTVAPDALPGVRDFRIATPNGASTLGQLVVTRDPVISEAGKNNTAAEAQAITVPAAVCGTIDPAEDVDFYKFNVAAGAALSFQVVSMRLEDKIHDLQQHSDPILTLRNSAGVTLAASDNYFYGDPLVTYVFDHEGEYLLEIRDVRYQGNKYWDYCIQISDRPLVTNVYPLGVRPGEETKLELVGFRLPESATVQITVPPDSQVGPLNLPLSVDGAVTNPAPLVVSDLPVETETAADNNTPETAQPVTVPAGINGRIESESDVDYFSFEATKGEQYSFEVIARRQQSALDSHLRILDDKGKQLQLNDDLRLGKRNFADSWIENWTVPADGRYVIEIRDLHLRGGPQFVYFLKVTRAEPYFELYADTDKTQLTPGTSGVIYVSAVRKNGFEGEIQLAVDGLPASVAADCSRILTGKGQDGCIVLTAAPDAAPSIANIMVTGTATYKAADDEEKQLTAVATPYQEMYQPGGGRGHWPVEMQTVCVGGPSDITAVKLSADSVTLKPGASQRIDVTIDRAEGFDKNVTLDVIYKHLNSVYGNTLPEGVTLDAGNSKTLLTGGATAGYITLKAADNAPPVENRLVPVMANVSINFVMKTTFAAKPLHVTVASAE